MKWKKLGFSFHKENMWWRKNVCGTNNESIIHVCINCLYLNINTYINTNYNYDSVQELVVYMLCYWLSVEFDSKCSFSLCLNDAGRQFILHTQSME